MEDNLVSWAGIVQEIAYAHESQYTPSTWVQDGITYINFHKLTITSNGEMEYKGNISNFDPAIFWKVEMLYKLYTDDTTLRILYGR